MELGTQLINGGNTLLDGVFTYLGRQAGRSKLKELNEESRELFNSYRYSALGDGAEGLWGNHLPENDFTNDVAIPMLSQISGDALYGIGNNFTKGYDLIKKLLLKKEDPASSSVSVPQNKIQGSNIHMSAIPAAGSGNPPVSNNLGSDKTANPSGMPFPGNLIMGNEELDANLLASIAQIAAMFVKKGAKLIPRQIN